MPQTLKEWLFLIAVAFVFLFPSLVLAGSAKPMSEQEASEMVMESGAGDLAASSEGLLLQKAAREKECKALLKDEEIISLYAARGWSAGELAGKAAQAPDIDDPRREKILKLIVEAYQYEGGPGPWFENAWHACVDGA